VDAEQKKRIIKRYIKEKSANPEAVNLGDNALAPYAALDRLLDHVDANNHGLFDLATFEANQGQWQQFTDILNYASTFTAGSPPTLTKISLRSADFGLQYWRNARDINALPKDNYYSRPTSKPAVGDADLDQKIQGSRAKLYALTQTFPQATVFDPANTELVKARIASLNQQMKPLQDGTVQKAVLQKQLNILLDLNKVNQLERITIPQDNGAPLTYCTLAEAAGGVTEKVSLISLAKVKTQLGQLCARDNLTVDLYDTERGQYKLNTEAIIKLPKHGDIKEVQHEALALNISRMLGLNTTASTSVSYNGHPALFVPFDNIRLLSDFATGKTFTAGLGFSGKTYTHYSTINPVGDGLQADCFVDDFGTALGLLYLSSDTDAIGGYCQNKALQNCKALFIFDQVIMDSDKFVLDSRLSLQPDQFFVKHLRHGKGRNRTLIEDSPMTTKYASLMQLKEDSGKILQYLSHVAWQHHNRGEAIKQQLKGQITKEARDQLTEELKDVQILEKDAETLKSKIQTRIKKIDEILPKVTGAVSVNEVRQVLILEKLLHNPVLFSDDGRPYKNPWTSRQDNPAQSVNDLNNGSVEITFKNKVSPEMLAFIKRQGGGDSLTLTSPKVITVSKAHLNALSEGMLHPEHTVNLNANAHYLDAADLAQIKDAYTDGHRTRIISAIADYQAVMNNRARSTPDKMACLVKTEADLKAFIQTAKDKGFGLHVLKKFHFDEQQRLQTLMNQALIPANLNQAFAAALKLDRVSEFNEVVREAITHNKLTDAQFTGFLTLCIQKEALATNHSSAQRESLALSQEVQRVMAQLKLPVAPLIVQLGGPVMADDRLARIDPIAALEADLRVEHDLLISRATTVSPSTSPVATVDDKVNEQIAVKI
jgi:hypothetical protein